MTLTAAGSPYTGATVTIASGVTVTAEPGAVVKLGGQLTVNGTLNAGGTSAQPVVFTSSLDSAAGQWPGIELTTASSVLNHTEVRYSTNGVSISGGVSPAIRKSTFRNNSSGGISVSGGSPQVTGNTLTGTGISFTGSGSPEIANNTVRDVDGNAISYRAGPGQSGEVRIHDNLVERSGSAFFQTGPSSWAAIRVYAQDFNSAVTGVTLSGNTVRDSRGAAIEYYTNPADDTIPADIDENTLSGNASNAVWVAGRVTQSAVWEDHGHTMVPMGGYNLTVAGGATLTLGPGLVLKPSQANARITATGSLIADGTALNPIVFTSLKDDSVGGDTNANGGATQPAPADWSSLDITTGASILDHAEVRYAGGVGIGTNVSPPITNSRFRNGTPLSITGGSSQVTDNSFSGAGLRFSGSGSPVIARNTVTDAPGSAIAYNATTSSTAEIRIHDNVVERSGGPLSPGYGGSAAIKVEAASSSTNSITGVTLAGNTIRDSRGAPIDYHVGPDDTIPPNIDENTLVGNASNAIWVSGKLAQSATWDPRGFPIVPMGGWNLTVAPGAILTFSPGLVVKPYQHNATIDVSGSLVADGTAANPIVFTSVKDDSVGGDTNADGSATQPGPGDWRTLGITAGSITHAKFLYGADIQSALSVSCPCPIAPKIRRSTVAHTAGNGIFVYGNPGPTADGGPPVSHINYRNIRGGTAIDKSGTQPMDAPYGDYDGCESGPGPAGCGPRAGPLIRHAPHAAGKADPCPGQDHQCGEDGDPVSLASGAFTYSHNDLNLTSKGAPLEFTRAYNSSDQSDAGLGPGWSHTGLIRAAELEPGGDVVVRRADGRGDLFAKVVGGYDAPSGVTDELTKQGDGTFRLTALDGTVYAFHVSSRIDTITDDHGLVTDYDYDANGRLSRIVDPSGQTITFAYNASNHITGVTDSTGRTVSYTYSAVGDLETVTDPLGGVTRYAYDSQHRLTSITDPRNVTFLRNSYDGQGRVSEQRDGLDNLWTFAYASDRSTVTDPRGGQSVYIFDGQGRVASETDQLGHTTSYGYDAQGNVDRITRPGGAITAYTYDARGNMVSETNPEYETTRFTFDSQNHLTSATDARNNAWTFTWTGNDLTSIRDPKNQTTTIAYDAAGQPTSVTDPTNHTTTIAYDARGNVLTWTNGENETTTFAYDARNQLTSKTEPGTPAELYERNALGDLLSVMTPLGHRTSYTYDANGFLTKITDPALKEWRIERNSMERPTAFIDPLGGRTEIAYDGRLNPTRVTDRRGNTTTYAYDLANRVTEIDRPATAPVSFGYDARGNRTRLTDPRNNVTTYAYDLADRLVRIEEPLTTTTTYAYDDAGNLTSVTDPRSNTTSFAYDELDRLTRITQPLAKETSFTYDAAGNLATRTAGTETVSHTYDAADRLVATREGANTLRSFAYDDAGRMTAATDAQGRAMQPTWDADDRLTAINDGRGQSVTRGYDSRGNLASQTDARGTLAYAYDELSRMTGLTDPQNGQSTFTYDAENNLKTTTLPNGVLTTNTYDADNRLTRTISEKGTTPLQSFDYAYDAAGNRTSQTDRLGQVTTYAYDALNRLTEFDPPSQPPTAYAYDAAGNRTQAGSQNFTYNALNQLTGSSDGATYSYDPQGRLREKIKAGQTTSYNWDALDQLTTVSAPQGTTSYTYDGVGRRAERTSSGQTEATHYGDLTDRPTFDAGAGGAVTQSWVAGPQGLLEERGGSTAYPLADAHGDITAVADGQGDVSSRQEFDPWGVQLSGPNRDFGWLGAPQRRGDPATGLVQMGVRHYDPVVGRFNGEDPVLGHVELGQSLDRYSYVWNNPVNRFDLDGRDVCLVGVCASELTPWDPFDDEAPIEQAGGAVSDSAGALAQWNENRRKLDEGTRNAAVERGKEFIKDVMANRPCSPVEQLYHFSGCRTNGADWAAQSGAACVEGGYAFSKPVPAPWKVPAGVAGCVLAGGINELVGPAPLPPAYE